MVVGGRELIDTLWNVNDKVIGELIGQSEGINRYIMECKCVCLSLCWSATGINRYIMECKYRQFLIFSFTPE